jgi:hypothetical protein
MTDPAPTTEYSALVTRTVTGVANVRFQGPPRMPREKMMAAALAAATNSKFAEGAAEYTIQHVRDVWADADATLPDAGTQSTGELVIPAPRNKR